jgi:hypothetical protein
LFFITFLFVTIFSTFFLRFFLLDRRLGWFPVGLFVRVFDRGTLFALGRRRLGKLVIGVFDRGFISVLDIRFRDAVIIDFREAVIFLSLGGSSSGFLSGATSS